MRNDLGELAAFAAVAGERSFTRAAGRLGVSQSALSHTVRGLERRLGLQLLARTTRSVAPTAAGAALLEDLAPALERIERSLAEAQQRRERPAGRIRLILSRTAAQLVLLPKLAQFARAYPEIVLEVTTSNDPADLVAGQYDAGVQIGEFHPARHDRGAGEPGRTPGRGGFAGILPLAQDSANAAGSEGSCVHRIPIQQRSVPVGV